MLDFDLIHTKKEPETYSQDIIGSISIRESKWKNLIIPIRMGRLATAVDV